MRMMRKKEILPSASTLTREMFESLKVLGKQAIEDQFGMTGSETVRKRTSLARPHLYNK